MEAPSETTSPEVPSAAPRIAGVGSTLDHAAAHCGKLANADPTTFVYTSNFANTPSAGAVK